MKAYEQGDPCATISRSWLSASTHGNAQRCFLPNGIPAKAKKATDGLVLGLCQDTRSKTGHLPTNNYS